MVNNIISIQGVGAVNFEFLTKKDKYNLGDWSSIIIKSWKHFKQLNIDFKKYLRIHLHYEDNKDYKKISKLISALKVYDFKQVHILIKLNTQLPLYFDSVCNMLIFKNL